MRRRTIQPRPVQLGSARHLTAIVSQHKLRRGRVATVEVVQELLALAVDRQRVAAAAHAEAVQLRSLASEIRAGTVELPEPQPMEELARGQRRRLMERDR